MESRNPFSKLKKRVKNRLTGKKAIPDETGEDAGGTTLEPTDPLPRPEAHTVEDDNRQGGGNKDDTGGNQVGSVDKPLGPDEPRLVSVDERGEPGVIADGRKSDWRSTASVTAKLLLRGVRDTADVFGPLKSVAGGLCFILENCDVWLSLYTIHDAHGFHRE